MKRSLVVGVVAVACQAGLATETVGQERELGPPPVQYNFAPPGARSLALGGSFIGLADDATASEANPAGLTILTKPEFSAHFRYTEFDNEVPNTVTGQGFDSFRSRVGSPSFFSVVIPWQQAAISLYYQRAADYRSTTSFEDFLGTEFYNVDEVSTLFRTENVGLSAAFKLSDRISVGGSIRGTRVRLESSQGATFTFPVFELVGRARIGATVDDSAFKTTFNAGILVTPTPKLSLGGVFKQGADFEFSQTFTTATDTALFELPVETRRSTSRLTVPDVFGGGIAIRATDQFTILADVVRIKYSQADLGEAGTNFYQRFGQGGREPLDDATEFHGGLEYTWTGGNDWIFSVRGGYYFNPDHDGLRALDSDQNHVTFGGGIVVKNRLQVDLAANLASALKEGLMSFVVRF
jgi:long-subunit fatty acid transport protein